MSPPDHDCTPESSATEMTWIVMPGQCNSLGTVFGGQVMSWIDVCAAVAAQRFCGREVVTASMDSLSFKGPIQLGEVAVIRARVNWSGKSSMEVGCRVESENPRTRERRHTSTAYLTFVALGGDRKPTHVPCVRCENDEDRRRFEAAKDRRAVRLALREKDRQRNP